MTDWWKIFSVAGKELTIWLHNNSFLGFWASGLLVIVHSFRLCLRSLNPDLRRSSLQCGLFSPAESSSTPESCRSLWLRSSSVRLEDWELRTEDRTSQLLSDRLQPLSLKICTVHMSKHLSPYSTCFYCNTFNHVIQNSSWSDWFH